MIAMLELPIMLFFDFDVIILRIFSINYCLLFVWIPLELPVFDEHFFHCSRRYYILLSVCYLG